MSEVKFPLIHGLKVGDDLLKQVILREATAGDVIEAQEESEKLVTVLDKDGNPEHVFVPSPTMVGVHVLRRQIKALGNMSGPLSLDQVKKLNPEDLNLIQSKINDMEEAAAKAVEAINTRGRSDQPGESD